MLRKECNYCAQGKGIKYMPLLHIGTLFKISFKSLTRGFYTSDYENHKILTRKHIHNLYDESKDAATEGVLYEKVIVKIFQILQENDCVRVSMESLFYRVARLQHSFVPVNFVTFSRTPILKIICERLLLNLNLSGVLFS